MSMRIDWTGLDALAGELENNVTDGLARAGDRIAQLLLLNMRASKRWRNRSGAADASLESTVVSNANGVLVIELRGSAYYLEWIEGGSTKLGFPSRYQSMVPVVQASIGQALSIAAEEVGG